MTKLSTGKEKKSLFLDRDFIYICVHISIMYDADCEWQLKLIAQLMNSEEFIVKRQCVLIKNNM